MKKNESITSIMTANPVTVHTQQKPSDVRKAMVENKFHHVPVVSGKKLVGIISAADILGVSVEGTGTDQRSMDAYLDHQFTLDSLMKKPHTIETNQTVRDAARVLADGSFHALPVVNASGELEGIVTSTDLIRYLQAQF